MAGPPPSHPSSHQHSRYHNTNHYRSANHPTTSTNEINANGRASPQHNNNISNNQSSSASASPAASAESLALSRLRTKSISHPLQQCQVTIYVPPNAVGAVIGRGGRTILSVQREAMKKSLGHTGAVRISVLGGNSNSATTAAEAAAGEEGEVFPSSANSNSQRGGSSNTWNYHEYQSTVQKNSSADHSDIDTVSKTPNHDDDQDGCIPVIIRGDPLGCFAAVRQILPLVYHHSIKPDIVFEVPIHLSKHGLLVGQDGLILAALSAEYAVRIMVPPPNEFMDGGDGNYWQPNQHSFPSAENSETPSGNKTVLNTAPLATNHTSTLPPNVIQLEGEVDNIEKCLIKILSIVAGERWFPMGIIVHPGKENEDVDINSAREASNTNADTSKNDKAFAIVTANHDAPKIGQNKVRAVQRKTNTLIRRKRGQFFLQGVKYGFTDAEDEPSLINSVDDDDEEDDAHPNNASKASVSYLISGKYDNVKSVAVQFEKLLGLESNSAVITFKDSTEEDGPAKNTGSGEDVEKSDKKRVKQRDRRNKKRGTGN